MVADLPALCAEFGGMRVTLLRHGSRDGSGAHGFHGHAPSLTPIQSEREKERWKVNLSLKSFVFALKNPHNFTARKLLLLRFLGGSNFSWWRPSFRKLPLSRVRGIAQ
jgi:hypothetical protein